MQNSNLLKDAIFEAQTIAIISHINPDGDTLGSMLALSKLIKKNFNKKTTNIIIGRTPDTYSFMEIGRAHV